jgi:ribonuclease Y
MQVAVWLVAIIAAATGALCFFVGVIYRKKVAESKLGAAEVQAENLIEEAKRNAEARAKEMLLEAKEESIKAKNEAEKEAKERRNEL